MDTEFADVDDASAWVDGSLVIDEVVYRLGLRAMPTLGLPSTLVVGETTCEWLVGPVVAQTTRVRQRPGLPVTFDKVMTRRPVGDDEFLLILSVRTRVSQPSEVEALLPAWRSKAEAAAGLLATVLDERVGHDEVFEDVVLLCDGEFVGAGDTRTRLRSFVPMEVTALDAPHSRR